MAILAQLGINESVIPLFGIFLFTFIFLTMVVFKPYFAAYNRRREKTVGNQETAEKLLVESESLQKEFEVKAREISGQFRAIYDQSKSEANKEYESRVSAARAQTSKELETNRQKISSEFKTAKDTLSKEVPEIQKAIMSKMLGKEIGPL